MGKLYASCFEDKEAITPAITNAATKRGWFCRYPKAVIPFQVMLVGLCVTFATPLGCAFFEQKAIVNVANLEPELGEVVKKKFPKVKEVYFNKGL